MLRGRRPRLRTIPWGVALETERDDLEACALAIDLRIDRADEPITMEDRHGPEPADPKVLRDVDLHPVAHTEEDLGALPVDDQVVKWRQQRGALGLWRARIREGEVRAA